MSIDTYVATLCGKCQRLVYIVNDSYFVDEAKLKTPITRCQKCGSALHMPRHILDGHDFQSEYDDEA